MSDKTYNNYKKKMPRFPEKPWQVRIGYSEEFGHLVISEIATHTHPSVVFSKSAALHCGGVTETDEDDYIVGVKNDDYSIITAAREIIQH